MVQGPFLALLSGCIFFYLIECICIMSLNKSQMITLFLFQRIAEKSFCYEKTIKDLIYQCCPSVKKEKLSEFCGNFFPFQKCFCLFVLNFFTVIQVSNLVWQHGNKLSVFAEKAKTIQSHLLHHCYPLSGSNNR